MSNQKQSENENEKKYLTEHDYDGIREFDYPLPSWWVIGFWLTIVFSVGYFIYYQMGPGPTLNDELNNELGQFKPKTEAVPSESFLASKFDDYLNNKEKLKIGEETYTSMCVACHKPLGGGDIGPNLADNYWLHGDGTPEAIYKNVKDGVPDKGMPAWGAILGDEKTYAVSAYVKSLKGGKPEKPKAPQGTLIE